LSSRPTIWSRPSKTTPSLNARSRGRSIGRKKKKGRKDSNQAARVAKRAEQREEVGAKRGRPRSADPPLARTRKKSAVVAATAARKRKRVSEADERIAIKVLYNNLGAPSPGEWAGRGGTISKIRSGLNLPGSARKVQRTLQDIVEHGDAFDPKAASARGGRKRKLSVVECEIAADMLRQGHGLSQTTITLNAIREKNNRSKVARTTVRDSVRAVLGAEARRTTKRATGNKDKESAWAKARLAQAKQYKDQLSRGGTATTRRGALAACAPLELNQIAWWDEKHCKSVLGPSGKFQWTYTVGDDFRFLPEEQGGKHFAPAQVVQPKYDTEARFAFGVMKKLADGGRSQVGVRLPPFDYTGQKMLGVAAYEKAVQKEVDATATKKGCWAQYRPDAAQASDPRYLEGGRYFLRYGDAWRDKIDDHLKLVCVTRLIDHIIGACDEAFRDTPYASTYVIAHDALSQFTEARAQAYLLSKGFGPARLLGPSGDTNAGTRYATRAVGDSPELMPCDSNLFADYSRGIKMHRAATWDLPVDDPRKFKFGTPAEVASTMRRVWQVCPTSERIVQDINRFPEALDKIIAAEGAYVPELDKRTGRRARRATRAFDYHPDCAGALNANAVKYDGWLGEGPRTSPRRALPPDSDEESASDSDCSSE
jgi:hypothetical protein